jgi:hypothetical protein
VPSFELGIGKGWIVSALSHFEFPPKTISVSEK